MRNTQRVLFNICFFLNCLLAFLLVFEGRVVLPGWLQVVGRMHPLVLHFPIVLLVLCIFWELFISFRPAEKLQNKPIGDWLLLSASLAAVLTALMGLFLSREDGYNADILVWHKWAGVGVSVLALLWFGLRENIRRHKGVMVATTFAGLTVIIITGHKGSDITHGENYLLAPIMDFSKPPVAFNEAMVYTDLIEPVLQQKCMSCHNSAKAKGQLVMETPQLLQRGGKSGKLWDNASSEIGLLLKRIHLPETDKKHMPPIGKAALTEDEKELIYRWIKSGSPFEGKVAALPPTDSFRLLAATMLAPASEEVFDFEPANDKDVQALNNGYCALAPIATGSPALAVNFYGPSHYSSQQLKDLLKVKEKIVWMNLNRMPVSDADLKLVGQFINLRKLNLSFTSIKGATLQELARLKELKELSLSGTAVNAGQLKPLATLPKLRSLIIWKANISENEMHAVRRQFGNTMVEQGFNGDTLVLALTPPVFDNDEVVLTEPVNLKLKHYINGVVIRYTLDGSEPDSIKSPVYNNKVLLNKSLTVKARAFKKGWISSGSTERTFFTSRYKPDSLTLLKPPAPEYRAFGKAILTDGEKGTTNYKDGKWLGYRENAFEAILYLKPGAEVSSVAVSQLLDINGYIMPPRSIEVWGGEEAGKLRLLKKITPPQPRDVQPQSIAGYEVSFTPQKVKVIKLVVQPVDKLPAWHRGKGEKGWVFVDEVFVN